MQTGDLETIPSLAFTSSQLPLEGQTSEGSITRTLQITSETQQQLRQPVWDLLGLRSQCSWLNCWTGYMGSAEEYTMWRGALDCLWQVVMLPKSALWRSKLSLKQNPCNPNPPNFPSYIPESCTKHCTLCTTVTTLPAAALIQ